MRNDESEGAAASLASPSPLSHTIPSSFSHYPSHPPPVDVSLLVLPEHECSYLPGRKSTSRALLAERMQGETYHQFMNAGFRRSGKLVYQPVCSGCRACVPLRVPVETFTPGKSQKRCLRKNNDLHVTTSEPVATEEKFGLYHRYMKLWHGKQEAVDDWEAFVSFLYDSPVQTLEFCYREASGRLLAVGICDVCPSSLSSVYFYHDPAQSRRGLGTFGALREIEAAREWRISHYYLGYWISGCATMQYKSDFRPCEILHSDGAWRPLEISSL